MSEGTPQQPFSKFTLKFRPGATAPLVSPPACGTYAAQGELTPWSAPTEPHFVESKPFELTQGTHEGPCPTAGVPPFHPQVISGTNNNAAGSYSPFYLRILREDGEQEITRFSTTLPPGLTGNLSGIPFCPDADIEAARTATGAEEETSPSCPAASEIGHTIVSAGVGTVLAQTPGKVYLAGPYHGAPLSIVSITSAKVGPFDLGTVVIRFALDINPTTAQVEVSANGSDPIPHIIKGIVVHVREVRVYMNRNQFILNPTNCNPLQITNTINGAGADPANPADQVPVTVNTPFQGADCSSLKFEPKFQVSTSGKTSKAQGASLTAKLTVPAALGTQANIREVKVDLPKQLPSRLTTLQKACTAAQFNTNPAGCPAASNIGYAKAITPILPVPLEGPVYFVSHGGEAFPEPGDRAPRLRLHDRPHSHNIHLQSRDHGKHVPHRPRPTRHQLRNHPTRGQILRPRRERKPLQGHEHRHGQEKDHRQGQGPQKDRNPQHQADGRRITHDANRIHRPKRDSNPPEHASQRDGMPEGEAGEEGFEGAQAAAEGEVSLRQIGLCAQHCAGRAC